MARLPEHRFSEETKLKCKERARFTCEYCGAKDVPLEIHHRIAIHFAQEIPCLAPAVISSLQNCLCLCPNCHKEFHNPKEETNESYIAIAAVVLQEYLKAMIDPHQDDWRDDLVQAYNGNYYKKKRKRRRRK